MMNEDPTLETLVLEGQTWVQCENPKCLKWRAICRLHAASLGPEEPWYCHLNPNIVERDCRVPTGPQPSRQDLKRSKLTYVYSEHVEGSLVVAKVIGYPRWPAIISADTASGVYLSKNERGVVESYHVTFLGHPRTVSWIEIQNVEPFGKMVMQLKSADKFARWWKCAMKEANRLRSMSLEERLKCCTDTDVLHSDTGLSEKKNGKSKKQRLRVSSLDEKRFQEEVRMLLKQKNLEPICLPLLGCRLSLLLLYQEVCLAGGYTEGTNQQLLPFVDKNYASSEEANPQQHLAHYCKDTGINCVDAKARLSNIHLRGRGEKCRGDLVDADYSFIPDELHEMDAFIDENQF
uniref:zinc finger CW-type PWWP domain protein 2 homolog isoform X1 n=1 Tax=Myxine glutinosa TaxID=7769 RepID=UPI00358E101A